MRIAPALWMVIAGDWLGVGQGHTDLARMQVTRWVIHSGQACDPLFGETF